MQHTNPPRLLFHFPRAKAMWSRFSNQRIETSLPLSSVRDWPMVSKRGPTLNSIRQTDVDTLMIGTQSRVRVRVRFIYLNQTGIRHQILGGVGVRVMHSRSDAPSSNPTHSILNCIFFLKNWRHFDFYEHFIKKFHIRKVKCLVTGGCQFGGWNQVTTEEDVSLVDGIKWRPQES